MGKPGVKKPRARARGRGAKTGKRTDLKALMLADLGRSGIPAASLAALGARVLDPRGVEALGGPAGRAAYRLPYIDPAGRDTGYFRLRFLTEDPTDKRKQPRYWQPAGSMPQLYFPRVAGLDLAAALQDPSEPLYVTEGEKKAYKACLEGLLTVAVGGVWAWRSKKKAETKTLALPDLDGIEWRNRRVLFVFDSDLMTKPDVQNALRAFAREVVTRGALPFAVKLPPGFGGAKVGFDDFLLAEGRAAFDSLEPEPLLGRLADELWRLNEELAFVRETATVWWFEQKRFLSDTQLRLAYANRVVTLVDGKGTVKQAPVSQEWLKWPQRREAPRVAFEPGQPRILSDGAINLWTSWGVEPRAGDAGPWVKLLDYLFAGAPEARAWFEAWCAYPLQHPGAKLYSAPVLFSLRHGVGKSLVGLTLGRIYGEAFVVLNQEQLQGSFNAWAAARLFALGDEVTGSDRRRDADRFKSLITQETVTINAKFQPPYTLADRLNYLFTTNHPDAFVLERDDRRFFIHEVEGDPMPRAFYDEYDAWLRGSEGVAAVFHHLLSLKLKGFNPREAPPKTAAKEAMLTLAFSDLDAFAERLREDPGAVLRVDGKPVTRELVTLDELLAFADPGGARRTTRVALAKALRRAGFKDLPPVRLTEGVTRLWAVRDQARWLRASHGDLKAAREGALVQASAAGEKVVPLRGKKF